MFGLLEYGATISNLGLDAVNVNGTDDCIGGPVGKNSGGIIASCYTSGNINRFWEVGGLVGYNSSGTVAYCYSIGMARGESRVGGLVGRNYQGSIWSSYSTGSVIGTGKIGGLVGESTLIPDQRGKYNTGIIGSSFWDIENSKQDTSDGDKTTDKMQATSTFLEAGWDFVDETGNGTEDIWWILEGRDYPRL